MDQSAKVKFAAATAASEFRDVSRKKCLQRAIAKLNADPTAVPGWEGSFYWGAKSGCARVCAGHEPRPTPRPWTFREPQVIPRLKWQRRTAKEMKSAAHKVKKAIQKKR